LITESCVSDTVAAPSLPSDAMFRTVANMDGRFQSSLDACLALSESIWELDFHMEMRGSYDNVGQIRMEMGLGDRPSWEEELVRHRTTLKSRLSAAELAVHPVVRELTWANPTAGVRFAGRTKGSHAEAIIAVAESRFGASPIRLLHVRPLPFDRQAIEVGLRNEHEREASDNEEAKRKKKSKRSTESGEAREKLIAALTLHHKYENGSCLNWEPVGCNQLAELAKVSGSTASEFFAKKFKGWGEYKRFCQNEVKILGSLAQLNGEMTPAVLFNRLPDEHADAEPDGGK